MEYIKIRFGGETGRLGTHFERALDTILRSVNPMFTECERAWNPPIDVFETALEVFITAEIAGVEKEDLDIEINHRAIRISGRRMTRAHVDQATFRLAEIQYGTFERILNLPAPIDPEAVSATYSNGLLQLRLAKSEAAQPRRIPISDD
ncbi:MAG: Hsp20/alpha crystallin family protein [Desulfosarcina sp.]|nr:Hsp20/alpha crystallin family protein [Desulfobacterales bacterium]